MNYKGINYDIGISILKGKITGEVFDAAAVTRELEIIKNELHCNAVKICGFDIESTVKASEIALKLGLTVLFSPALLYDNLENTMKHILESAQAAEKLRTEFSNVIFVTGCELSFFTRGFIKGNTGTERLERVFSPLSILKNKLGLGRTYNERLNSFLLLAVIEIRKRFNGRVTYAPGAWEKINWNLFDLVGIHHYRAPLDKAPFTNPVRDYQQFGEPHSLWNLAAMPVIAQQGGQMLNMDYYKG